MVTDPTSASTVYAGTHGYVYKSTNAGASWLPMLFGSPDDFWAQEIVSLAIDPSRPGTLYAGTEGGVFKSTDGGASWVELVVGLPDSTLVSALTLSSSPSTTLYLAGGSLFGGTGSLYRSTDGGASWTDSNVGLSSQEILTLAIDPAAPTAVYLGTPGGVFKSTNHGGSWTTANIGLSGAGIATLAIDPVASTTLYAGGAGMGAFKSTDGGAIWAELADDSWGYRSKIDAITIDATTPSVLYAAVDGLYSPENGRAASLQSTDGGASWVRISVGLPRIHHLVYWRSIPPWLPRFTSGNRLRCFLPTSRTYTRVSMGMQD